MSRVQEEERRAANTGTWLSTDSRLMAKDKSEKKRKHVSDAVPAEAEEDVEMKVSSGYACLEE
jgi:hypothetical protein